MENRAEQKKLTAVFREDTAEIGHDQMNKLGKEQTAAATWGHAPHVNTLTSCYS